MEHFRTDTSSNCTVSFQDLYCTPFIQLPVYFSYYYSYYYSMKFLSYEEFLAPHDKSNVNFLTAVLISALSCYSQLVDFFFF